MSKRLDTKTIAAAFLITTFIFAAGIGAGTLLNQKKADVIRQDIDEVSSDIESFRLQFLLLDTIGENATCQLLQSRLQDVNSKSYSLMNKLGKYEDDALTSPGDTQVVNLRRDYYRSLIEYWAFNQKVETACQERTPDILYFFSSDCPKCNDQGVVLSYYKETLGEDILIFPLQSDFNDPFIQTLTNYYNVTTQPTLVINGERKIEEFKTREGLKEVLCEESSGLSICNQ